MLYSNTYIKNGRKYYCPFCISTVYKNFNNDRKYPTFNTSFAQKPAEALVHKGFGGFIVLCVLHNVYAFFVSFIIFLNCPVFIISQSVLKPNVSCSASVSSVFLYAGI